MINGIDLEGLEFYQTTNIQPDGAKSIDINIKVKVVNNTAKMTKGQIKNRMEQAKVSTNETLSGVNAEGVSVNTTLDYKLVKKVDPKKDFYVSFVDETEAGTELGYTKGDIGNTSINGFEILSDQAAGIFFDSKGLDEEISNAITHEFGHGGGLYHKDSEKNPQEIKESMTPLNFMDKKAVGKPVATPQQLSQIIKSIPESRKKVVYQK